MLSESSRNQDLVIRGRLDLVSYSPHFDVPTLRTRARAQHQRRMALCVRGFFIALAVAVVAIVTLTAVLR